MSVARNGLPTVTAHTFRVAAALIKTEYLYTHCVKTVSLSEGKLFALLHDFQYQCHRIAFSCRGGARERPVADIALCQDTQVSGLRFIGC
jgi:hypothetical protein